MHVLMKFHECKLYGTRKRSDNFGREEKNQKRIKMYEGLQSRNKVDSNIKRDISSVILTRLECIGESENTPRIVIRATMILTEKEFRWRPINFEIFGIF